MLPRKPVLFRVRGLFRILKTTNLGWIPKLAFTTEFPVTGIKISHLIQKFGKFQRVENFFIIIMRS